jgi:hypothetical protein
MAISDIEEVHYESSMKLKEDFKPEDELIS